MWGKDTIINLYISEHKMNISDKFQETNYKSGPYKSANLRQSFRISDVINIKFMIQNVMVNSEITN